VNPELPPGYRYEDNTLYQPNGQVCAELDEKTEAHDVALIAWAHDSRANVRIAQVEHLLGRRLWHGSAS
jgi:hypothetical protein